MDQPPPSYRREFLKSPHHAWFALLTAGTGFMTGQPLYLLAGLTAYAVGWLYLPDLKFFRRWVDHRRETAQRAVAESDLAEFNRKRQGLLDALSSGRRARYAELAAVCHDVERATAENPLAGADPTTDPRLRKLDDLMWTYLRLLNIEDALDRFLETERRDAVPRLVQDAEAEVADLGAEIESSKKAGRTDLLETKERLLNSRLERLEVLHKRLKRIEQAQANLSLVVSEQERLDQQIKLIRADAMASKNAQAMSARIDATIEHLDQTNKWIAELDEFKDLVGDLPPTETRVGYAPQTVPPILPTPRRLNATPTPERNS